MSKQVSVRFFLLEPFGNPLPFKACCYPRDRVFAHLRTLDPAAESYRIKEDLFGGETLCLLHDGEHGDVLGAYYKDLLNLPQTEYKGELAELILRDGEAPVEGSYAMFFPHDVVGVIRSSSKAPGPTKIGLWLSDVGGVSCGLVPLRDPDATAQLNDAEGRIRRLFLRMCRDRVRIVDSASPSVATALRAAGAAIPASHEVGVEMSAGRTQDRQTYSSELRERVEELSGLFDEFESAQVEVTGRQRPINLKRSYLISPQQVLLIDTKKLSAASAAEAISKAYDQEKRHIQYAAQRQRGGTGHETTT